MTVNIKLKLASNLIFETELLRHLSDILKSMFLVPKQRDYES